MKNNINDMNFLKRLKMVSLVNTFPIVILDEMANQLKNSLNEDSNSTPNSKTKNSKVNSGKNIIYFLFFVLPGRLHLFE